MNEEMLERLDILIKLQAAALTAQMEIVERQNPLPVRGLGCAQPLLQRSLAQPRIM